MTFKNFLAEAIILEGGAAIKGSHQLTQAEAREIIASAIHDLKVALKLPSNKITTVGSAGAKPGDQLSGDIDIAVEADITAVKKAVEELALDGRFRHMPGLNVYSYAKLHGSKVAQVDVIPTTSIKLAKWAYYNDPGDLKIGLKGSHRNELLFAIAKHAELVSLSKAPDGTDSARSRLVFDLSRGLYRFTQDRTGKRGLTKSFSTVTKSLISSSPDVICQQLLGVNAAQAMTFHDVLKVMLSKSFKHRDKLKQIIDRAIQGLESKKLVVPHELRVAIISEAIDPTRQLALDVQQRAAEHGFDYSIKAMSELWRVKHAREANRSLSGFGKGVELPGVLLFLDDGVVDHAIDSYRDEVLAYHRSISSGDYAIKQVEKNKASIMLERFPTEITISSNGSFIVWCNGVSIGCGIKIASNTFDYVFKSNQKHLS